MTAGTNDVLVDTVAIIVAVVVGIASFLIILAGMLLYAAVGVIWYPLCNLLDRVTAGRRT